MSEERAISNLIRYTLNYLKVQEGLRENGATDNDLDTLTSQFYEKALDEAAHQGLDRREAFNIILSTLTGGVVLVPGVKGQKEREI